MRKRILICDKCGKEIELQSKMPARYIQIRLLTHGDCDKELDLCDECNSELGRFLFEDNPDARLDWENHIGWQNVKTV